MPGREKFFALFAHFFIADCTNIFISFKALSGGKKMIGAKRAKVYKIWAKQAEL